MDEPRLVDRTFGVAMVLKGLHGLIETIGGILLMVLPVSAIDNAAVRLTRVELSEDSHDFFAHNLLRLTADLQHTRTFGAIYLLSHGLVKVVLVIALLRRQRWAYPAMLAFLVAFIAYQCYRMTYAPSIGLVLLTVFDAFVVWIVWVEYRA
ncbi:MAG: hypothetical protein QOF60_1925 [Actinomycetota bacterium]|jgi:uncharacterized membrane protein|nr:hypothetical protein [Actinomycetota bacterium]